MGCKDWFYRVEFKEPPIEGDDRTEFYFSSLAAIYEQFAPEQVGCNISGGRNKVKPRQRSIIRRTISYTIAKSKAEIRRI